MLRPLLILFASHLTSSGDPYGKVTFVEAPKIINVSSYDPKKKARASSSYSPLKQAALRENGAQGIIARLGKGLEPDSKCADFLVGAGAQGLKLGIYYFVRPTSVSAQVVRNT
jgi:hypothetical protein